MRTQKAYCSACDRQVEVVVPEDLPEGSLPSAHDPASCICLEFGESCTGSLCPLFEVPTGQMEENYRQIVKEIREGRSGNGKGGEGEEGRVESAMTEKPENQKTYCTHCQKEVLVAISPAAPRGGQANAPGSRRSGLPGFRRQV